MRFLVERTIALCEKLGGSWSENDMGWQECKITGLRVCISPHKVLVEINSTLGRPNQKKFYSDGGPLIAPEQEAANAVAYIRAEFDKSVKQTDLFLAIVHSVKDYLKDKGVFVVVKIQDDYARFETPNGYTLFSVDADDLMNPNAPFDLYLNGQRWPVRSVSDITDALSSVPDIEYTSKPWTYKHHVDMNGFYFIGETAYYLRWMLAHGGAKVEKFTGSSWTQSSDPVLHVILGHEKPKAHVYYSITFNDKLTPEQVEEICNS